MSAELVDRFVAARYALNDGNPQPFLDLLANDVMWWDTGRDDPLVGREAVSDRLRELAAFEVNDEVHDAFANDEHLVALIHGAARNADGDFTYSTAEVYHLDEDGRVAKRQAFAHDSAKIQRLFARSPDGPR